MQKVLGGQRPAAQVVEVEARRALGHARDGQGAAPRDLDPAGHEAGGLRRQRRAQRVVRGAPLEKDPLRGRCARGRPEGAPLGAEHLCPVIHTADGGHQEAPPEVLHQRRHISLAVQSILVEILGRPVRRADHGHVPLRQQPQNLREDRGVGDVGDGELVQAEGVRVLGKLVDEACEHVLAGGGTAAAAAARPGAAKGVEGLVQPQ
mmetsp:Transcript_85791/g.246235  ORF Transcript_85791/g.246235 Transcript_85791/m.246235 type:complete len:206 (+) Transcript_85791:716-1333(+)